MSRSSSLTPGSLSKSHLGSTATVLIGAGGYTRVYYQAADGSIHERKGRGPSMIASEKYTDRMLIPPGIARVNTPLAIRLYYISNENYLRELESNDFSDTWDRGLFDQMNFEAAPNSGLLYSCNALESRNPGNPRVGYQSATNPEYITEAVWIDDGWKSAPLW